MPPSPAVGPLARRSEASPGPAPRLSQAVLVCLVALAITAAVSGHAQAEESPTPKLSVEERVYSTGEIARDQVVEHAFKIRNSGGAPLSILKVVARPALEILSRPTTLAPGEAGEVRVRMPLLYEKPGALLEQIALRTNDPASPELKLELKILSTEYVAAKPGYARWIAVQNEKRGTISQLLAANDKQDFEVLRTSPPPPGITTAIAVASAGAGSVPGAPRSWNVDLTLAADAPVGPITGTLLVYINHPKQKIVPIPLSGFMRPIVAVTPERVTAGEIKLEKKRNQAFIVQTFATELIHVTKVEHDLKGFPPATLETRTAGREYMVRIEFDPATMPKGVLHGALKIHTDSAKVPLIVVPIDGTVP